MTRLGSKGADEIKQHPWFAGVNFQDLLLKKLKPPFVPKLLSNLDVTNFGKEFTEEGTTAVSFRAGILFPAHEHVSGQQVRERVRGNGLQPQGQL